MPYRILASAGEVRIGCADICQCSTVEEAKELCCSLETSWNGCGLARYEEVDESGAVKRKPTFAFFLRRENQSRSV
jgi:hypothetical protein